MEGGGKEGKVGSRFGWKMIRPEFRSKRKRDNAEDGSTKGEARNTEQVLRREKKHALQPHEDLRESAYRRTYVADNGKKNRKRTRQNRSGKKCRRSNRSRLVNTKKRKQIQTKTNRSKPTQKGTESVRKDQPSPIRMNTNRNGSRSNRKANGRYHLHVNTVKAYHYTNISLMSKSRCHT